MVTKRKPRGSGDTVAIGARLGREDWLRVHALAARLGVPIQHLIVVGLSAVLTEHGQSPIVLDAGDE